MGKNFGQISAKIIKKAISDKMTNRKEGISVVLGECDDIMDRIEIKYPKTSDHISLNPITPILKSGFFVAQIIDFYYPTKRVILLIRYRNK